MAASETWAKWRYRLVPDHALGEILSKNWIDTLIPAFILVLVLIFFGTQMPNFLSAANLNDIGRIYGEYLFIAIGMTIVMMAGGIDLSVGSIFALCNFVSLALINYLELPLILGIPAVIAVGGAVGLINGILIGYLGLRAFLTTLVMLIIVRASVDMLLLDYAMIIGRGFNASLAWEFMALGNIFGIPSSLVAVVVVAVAAHLVLTRFRFGWHLMAVGGSRRSAYNAGIRVKRTVCATYVISGMLCGLASTFYAARLSSASAGVGLGLEVTILTAVVLGGISLGGGRGSIVKAALGTVIIILVQNSLIRMGLMSGASSLVLGSVLLLAVAIDVRWMKNRSKILARSYVSPTYFKLPPLPETAIGSDSPYALNDKLRGVEAIGLGELDGPEDMIFDREDNMYCGSRHGDVIRIFAPDYTRIEVFAHIGGHPLGMAFDARDNLHVCVGGMGLFMIAPDQTVTKLSDETNRSWLSIADDSRLRLADDLDIAPDGRVFFSEATVRYEMYDWMVDALEARGNGRIICYDPKDGSSRTVLPNLQLPNGICVEFEGQSLLYAETWGCRITRYWFDGPRKGQRDVVIANLPGYPDNINRASDGTYWCALCGMRSPVFDLAQRMPGFRRRMVQSVSRDDWLYPNMNTGCVIKFDKDGNVLDVLWDLGGEAHPMITSIREHKGYLYLGGIYNNRIGRYPIPDADPNWTSHDSYWGELT
ncbi:monosaccharide ABC transporter membrane protein, CUT2 family [Salinihabitans flavidus]|uniref:Monosaccharide ABC transporter membrane protein, CUT2 family n=1 Tax=Salinihabitans flavidus TaxID=569882 RepID=A0A1H8V7R7_9RHOB|nr:SMP-30/gluconolactonase/LRE family protein [Salinihabitans flavidus]SEP11317.1 monosaccharide ABC transporter membrane protein, CUT2 family [Salinihabitans flavidus]